MKNILYTVLIAVLTSAIIACGENDDSSGISSDSTGTIESLSGNGVFILAGLSGNILRSTNKGSSFDNVTSPTSKNLYGVVFGDSVFVVAGDNGTNVKSSDNGSSFLTVQQLQLLILYLVLYSATTTLWLQAFKEVS